MVATKLSTAEVNHLRCLLGYVRCEIWQSPEEMVDMMKTIGPKIGPVSNDGKARLVESYQKAANVPKYVRAAVKALEKAVKETEGEIVDGENVSGSRLMAPIAKESNK